MAVTIIKEFWNKNDLQWETLQKVVFTSPHIDGVPAPSANTRSHILPGSEYIGTWYEAVDKMYTIEDDQSFPTSTKECYFSELFLYMPAFDFSTDTTISGLCRYNPTLSGSCIIQYDRSNYATVVSGSVDFDGTTTLSGVNYREYTIDLTSVNGTSTISGSITTTSGSAAFYCWDNAVQNDDIWAHAGNSLIFEVTEGEAYNCRLTAWDDNTHSSTDNQILDEEHYMVVCCAYRAGSNQTNTVHALTDAFHHHEKHFPKSNHLITSMIHPPGIRLALKGNVSYYGDFDFVHRPVEDDEHGEYILFKPYLYDMTDAIPSGNYDFVTTLHYQYT